MGEGHVIAAGKPSDVLDNERVRDTYLGDSFSLQRRHQCRLTNRYRDITGDAKSDGALTISVATVGTGAKLRLSYLRLSMKQALQLKLGQQLALTPQLQQAIKLLQLSTATSSKPSKKRLGQCPSGERKRSCRSGRHRLLETLADEDGEGLSVDTVWEDVLPSSAPPTGSPTTNSLNRILRKNRFSIFSGN